MIEDVRVKAFEMFYEASHSDYHINFIGNSKNFDFSRSRIQIYVNFWFNTYNN